MFGGNLHRKAVDSSNAKPSKDDTARARKNAESDPSKNKLRLTLHGHIVARRDFEGLHRFGIDREIDEFEPRRTLTENDRASHLLRFHRAGQPGFFLTS